MTQFDFTFEKDLEQIRASQAALLDEIDEIKDRYAGDERSDLEQIQNRTIAAVAEIDKIINRQQSQEEQIS